MKAIILAAGQGTRLQPLTNDKPKCMVEYKKKAIITYILEVMNKSTVGEIAVVDGYKKEVLESFLKDSGVSFFTNTLYDKTNMVSTLFSAVEFMDNDIIISYADIVYKQNVIDALIKAEGDFCVVVDKDWKSLWKARMENPLDDAETLKINNGKIIELGKKPSNYDEIEGQYIGLMKITKNVLQKVINFYNNLDREALYDGKDFDNIYMTSFIQLIIDNVMNVNPVFINGGWLEIDSTDDLRIYEKMNIV